MRGETMKWMLANPLRTLSPLGLVAVGAAVGIAGVPLVKSAARGLAVQAIRSTMAVNNMIKNTTRSMARSWEDMVMQARSDPSEARKNQPVRSAGIVEVVPDERNT